VFAAAKVCYQRPNYSTHVTQLVEGQHILIFISSTILIIITNSNLKALKCILIGYSFLIIANDKTKYKHKQLRGKKLDNK
jgi:hypothetical protein